MTNSSFAILVADQARWSREDPCAPTPACAVELSQPIAAITFYAAAAQNWLNRDDPDIGEALFAVMRVVDFAKQASDIVRPAVKPA